jgi:hypothetical protein
MLHPNYVQPVELLDTKLNLESGDRPGGLECRRHTRKTWTKHEDAKIFRIIKELNLSINQRIPYQLIAQAVRRANQQADSLALSQQARLDVS